MLGSMLHFAGYPEFSAAMLLYGIFPPISSVLAAEEDRGR
jgi:hypothetical protein